MKTFVLTILAALFSFPKRFVWWLSGVRLAANAANPSVAAQHQSNVTKLADAAIATRFLIVKYGTDVDHAAITTAATDVPLGICTDEAAAAEDPVNVFLLGAQNFTGKVTLGGTVAVGDNLTSDGAGKGIKATVQGSQIIGQAMVAGVSGDLIEFEPIKQTEGLVVAATWTLTGNAGNDLTALKVITDAAGITKS